MVEHFNQEDFERLKHEVETLVGRTIMSPKDFEFLTCQILGYTNETISVSTLKRMWGYVVTSCKPSVYNLNLLSRMVGYPDWESFVAGKNAVSSSRFFVKSKLVAEALNLGEQVKVKWNPGRLLVIEYCGDDRFEVMESVNSKLSVGDTFVCHQLVADEPLYLSNLHHPASRSAIMWQDRTEASNGVSWKRKMQPRRMHVKKNRMQKKSTCKRITAKE